MKRPSLTKNHQVILDILTEHGVGTHLTAYDLLAEAKKRQPAIGLATVHRAVAQLHEQGLISKVLVAGKDSATYEPPGEQHAHFLCTRCGGLHDVEYELPRRTISALAAEFGFRVDQQHVTLSGLCRACQRVSSKGAR